MSFSIQQVNIGCKLPRGTFRGEKGYPQVLKRGNENGGVFVSLGVFMSPVSPVFHTEVTVSI